MANRAGIGPLVGYAARGSREEPRVERALQAAAWHLNATSKMVRCLDELCALLETEDPGILLILEPSARIRDALAAEWIVLTSRRHRDARHGRELFWVASERPEVLMRALRYIAGLGPALIPIRHAAHNLAHSLTTETFLERWATPLVSVIMPLFEAEKTVLRTMRCVLDQTVSDLELILVDDGSSDASRECSFEILDPRVVRVWQSCGGPAAARNMGIAQAQAETYLTFLDADDLWEPVFLERMIETLELASPNVGLAYCDFGFSLDGGEEIVQRVEDASFPALMMSDGLVPTGAFAFRRRVLAEAGLQNEDIARGEDHAWLLQIASSFELVRVPEVLFHYQRSTTGQLLTSTPDSRRLEQARLNALDSWARRAFSQARVV